MGALGNLAQQKAMDVANDPLIKFGESKVTIPNAPEPPPPPPTPDEAPVADAASQQKKAKGRASTVLTGNYGLLGGGSTASRTLLGY